LGTVLINPQNPLFEAFLADIRAAAASFGDEIDVLTATTNREIDATFATLEQKPADVLLVGPDALLNARRVQIVRLVRSSSPLSPTTQS
jgi:hypothetical protein